MFIIFVYRFSFFERSFYVSRSDTAGTACLLLNLLFLCWWFCVVWPRRSFSLWLPICFLRLSCCTCGWCGFLIQFWCVLRINLLATGSILISLCRHCLLLSFYIILCLLYTIWLFISCLLLVVNWSLLNYFLFKWLLSLRLLFKRWYFLLMDFSWLSNLLLRLLLLLIILLLFGFKNCQRSRFVILTNNWLFIYLILSIDCWFFLFFWTILANQLGF